MEVQDNGGALIRAMLRSVNRNQQPWSYIIIGVGTKVRW